MRTRLVPLGTLIALAAAATCATAAPAPTVLNATVGGGSDGNAFRIALTKGGRKVTSLTAGSYRIRVSDVATIHNFRLTGPGVNRATSVPGTSRPTWNVTLRRGAYTFVCDPHPTQMRGTFRVTR